MKKVILSSIVIMGIVAVGGTASAQETLGQEGQIAISSDLQLSVGQMKLTPPAGDSPDPSTFIVVRPALDYFVIESLSIGGALGVNYEKAGDTKTTGFEIGARVGYAIPIDDDTLSFWPKLGLSYHNSSIDAGDANVGSNQIRLDIFAPLTISPEEHFFIGIGPGFSMDLSSKTEGEDGMKTTTYGIFTQVGGYF